MSPVGMPWIKSHVKQLDDIRLVRTSEQGQLAYYKLSLLAGKCDADGSFIMNGEQLTEDEIAFYISMDPRKLKAAIKELNKNKLISVNGHGPYIADFRNEQVSQAQRQEQWRLRQQRHRTGTSDSDESHAPVTSDTKESHAPRTRIQNQNQNPESESELKPTTPKPSSRKKDLAGGRAGSKSESEKGPRAETKLNKKQRARKDIIIKILGSFGIRKPKLETIATILAMRSYKSDEQVTSKVLAGIASSIADKTARDKEAIAAHRLEKDEVPPRVEDPKEWKDIPQNVLAAAGIGDLQRYITGKQYATYGIEH